MGIEDWTDLDLSYLLAFGEHPDLPEPPSALPTSEPCAVVSIDLARGRPGS